MPKLELVDTSRGVDFALTDRVGVSMWLEFGEMERSSVWLDVILGLKIEKNSRLTQNLEKIYIFPISRFFSRISHQVATKYPN